MKYSDDFFDVNNNLVFASIFGVLCGLVSAIATISDVGAAYMFISILIGNLIALKVDGIHHIITLAVFVIVCLIFGVPDLSLIVLLICTVAALSDEVGHETISKVTDNGFINLFFEYRFVMKIVVFLLAIFGAFTALRTTEAVTMDFLIRFLLFFCCSSLFSPLFFLLF